MEDQSVRAEDTSMCELVAILRERCAASVVDKVCALVHEFAQHEAERYHMQKLREKQRLATQKSRQRMKEAGLSTYTTAHKKYYNVHKTELNQRRITARHDAKAGAL